MLSNLSEPQTFTLFHREEFSKECISNISEVLDDLVILDDLV
jgi:hypothetical protein